MRKSIRKDSFDLIFEASQPYPPDFEVQFDKIDASGLNEKQVNDLIDKLSGSIISRDKEEENSKSNRVELDKNLETYQLDSKRKKAFPGSDNKIRKTIVVTLYEKPSDVTTNSTIVYRYYLNRN